MKKLLLTSLLFIFLDSLCFASHNQPGDFTFTLGAADYIFSAKRDLKNTALPNVALDYNFNQQWAMEGGIGMINTNQRSNNQGVHGFLYLLDAMYRFKPCKNVEPYLLAGIGAIGLKPSGNDNEYQGNINAGIGSQLFVSERIALRADVRDVYTMTGGKNDWMINFGVSFLFDGKPTNVGRG